MVPGPPVEEGSVTVVVRVRPQTQREQEGNRQRVVQVVGECMLVFDPEESSLPGIFAGFQAPDPAPKRKGKDLKFVFDRVFGESATQAEVFENTTKEILDGVLDGYNCSVFAYGATGAGKTHTMLGSEEDPGIMYLTMEELYKKIEAKKEEKHCEVLISYQEVYNEQIHDLLEPKGPLAIREDPEKGVMVHGLSFHQPRSAEQLLKMLARGNKNRTQHPTDINATSSRSHAVFQIFVKQRDRVMGIAQDVRVAKMSLIDLAGSERASATNTKGDRLREGANINRSLLALINVINALADAKLKSNVLSLDCHISQYAAFCEQLKAEVADLRGRLRVYEENTPVVNPCMPSLLAHSVPEQGEISGLKEAGLGCDTPNVGDGDTKTPLQLLKPNGSTYCSGKSSLDQESEMQPGCSSTESSNPVKQEEKLRDQLQEMDKPQLERLAASILHVARRQYALLKAANLLTPDMKAEFEEVDCLVQKGSGEIFKASAPEGQVGKLDTGTRTDLGQEVRELVDNVMLPASHPTEECANPVCRSGTPPTSPEFATVFKTPHLPTKKRRKSPESTTPSQRSDPPAQKGRAKRQRKACLSPQELAPLKEWATFARVDCTSSTPIADRVKSTSLHPPQLCPLTITKCRVPLATSAAQNGSTPAPPSRSLNATFDLCEDPCPPQSRVCAPEFPAWENVQHLSNHQGAPLIPSIHASVQHEGLLYPTVIVLGLQSFNAEEKACRKFGLSLTGRPTQPHRQATRQLCEAFTVRERTRARLLQRHVEMALERFCRLRGSTRLNLWTLKSSLSVLSSLGLSFE
ncbi:hypothetical protein lerEdw1_017663 [Lerista edwardsae]|nr:hypothetical protein lerEdw1_017663 [Lerista edwardsae]